MLGTTPVLSKFISPALYSALLQNDLAVIRHYEEAAFYEGYGPLACCDALAAPREQKQLCPTWHRDSTGMLTRGIMDRTEKCPAVFEFYYPYDLNACPYVLLVYRNAHSHGNPKPSKTPQAILNVFNSLLERLDWKLVDATLRRIILDLAFINGLRSALGWVDLHDPTLRDLHPSLSNSDHTAWMINKLRHSHYPQGTGLEGAYHILSEHRKLPLEQHYVRCVEEHSIPGEGKISIEFEIEAWFPEYHCSIVVAHVFTTSQSAKAHRILFNSVFAIVYEDTGETVKFQHLHGVGFDTFMADGHLGQALGLGLCCEDMCRSLAGYCAIEWTKALHALMPYKHLAHMYRYCFAHFVRNVLALKGHVTLEVQTAMMSIASAKPLPNFEATLQQIQQGGKKAADWLRNKETACGFDLAALYQPASKIPIDIWKASPSTSNGNEQAHRSINRDGTKLTMLAGIMRRMQYDSQAMSGLTLLCAVQKHTAHTHDVELQTTYKQLVGLQHNFQTQSDSLKHAMEKGMGVEQAFKKLHKTDAEFHKIHAGLSELQNQSSGTMLMPALKEPSQLLDHHFSQTDPSVFMAHYSAHRSHLTDSQWANPPQIQEPSY
ncbi:hypothetical protein K439DRAFT_1622602 [Ramaria rubella]|nr:hypothetical protein K439DRAFT_1622602 [Ramaria rubella]